MSYNVDLSDPRVRQHLGPQGVATLAGPGGSVVQLAGDAPDPRGITDHRGMASTHHLSLGKQEVGVVFGDRILTVDVYAIPGEPITVHLICPRCRKTLTVRGDRKVIDFDPNAPNPRGAVLRATGSPELAVLAQRGRLSIEAFECTWEMGDGHHARGSFHTGVSLCRQRLAIEDNRAQEA
jgi:hypothetical protein